MECIVKKLRSRAGESIAEVMVALLISALGMSLLVGMIGASVRIIDNSTKAMHLQYAKANADTKSNSNITLTPNSGNGSVSSILIDITKYAVSLWRRPWRPFCSCPLWVSSSPEASA